MTENRARADLRRLASCRRIIDSFFSSSSEESVVVSIIADTSGALPASSASSASGDSYSIHSQDDECILEIPIPDPAEQTRETCETASAEFLPESSPLPELIVEVERRPCYSPPEYYDWLEELLKKLSTKKDQWSPDSNFSDWLRCNRRESCDVIVINDQIRAEGAQRRTESMKNEDFVEDYIYIGEDKYSVIKLTETSLISERSSPKSPIIILKHVATQTRKKKRVRCRPKPRSLQSDKSDDQPETLVLERDRDISEIVVEAIEITPRQIQDQTKTSSEDLERDRDISEIVVEAIEITPRQIQDQTKTSSEDLERDRDISEIVVQAVKITPRQIQDQTKTRAELDREGQARRQDQISRKRRPPESSEKSSSAYSRETVTNRVKLGMILYQDTSMAEIRPELEKDMSQSAFEKTTVIDQVSTQDKAAEALPGREISFDYDRVMIHEEGQIMLSQTYTQTTSMSEQVQRELSVSDQNVSPVTPMSGRITIRNRTISDRDKTQDKSNSERDERRANSISERERSRSRSISGAYINELQTTLDQYNDVIKSIFEPLRSAKSVSDQDKSQSGSNSDNNKDKERSISGQERSLGRMSDQDRAEVRHPSDRNEIRLVAVRTRNKERSISERHEILEKIIPDQGRGEVRLFSDRSEIRLAADQAHSEGRYISEIISRRVCDKKRSAVILIIDRSDKERRVSDRTRRQEKTISERQEISEKNTDQRRSPVRSISERSEFVSDRTRSKTRKLFDRQKGDEHVNERDSVIKSLQDFHSQACVEVTSDSTPDPVHYVTLTTRAEVYRDPSSSPLEETPEASSAHAEQTRVSDKDASPEMSRSQILRISTGSYKHFVRSARLRSEPTLQRRSSLHSLARAESTLEYSQIDIDEHIEHDVPNLEPVDLTLNGHSETHVEPRDLNETEELYINVPNIVQDVPNMEAVDLRIARSEPTTGQRVSNSDPRNINEEQDVPIVEQSAPNVEQDVPNMGPLDLSIGRSEPISDKRVPNTETGGLNREPIDSIIQHSELNIEDDTHTGPLDLSISESNIEQSWSNIETRDQSTDHRESVLEHDDLNNEPLDLTIYRIEPNVDWRASNLHIEHVVSNIQHSEQNIEQEDTNNEPIDLAIDGIGPNIEQSESNIGPRDLNLEQNIPSVVHSTPIIGNIPNIEHDNLNEEQNVSIAENNEPIIEYCEPNIEQDGSNVEQGVLNTGIGTPNLEPDDPNIEPRDQNIEHDVGIEHVEPNTSRNIEDISPDGISTVEREESSENIEQIDSNLHIHNFDNINICKNNNTVIHIYLNIDDISKAEQNETTKDRTNKQKLNNSTQTKRPNEESVSTQSKRLRTDDRGMQTEETEEEEEDTRNEDYESIHTINSDVESQSVAVQCDLGPNSNRKRKSTATQSNQTKRPREGRRESYNERSTKEMGTQTGNGDSNFGHRICSCSCFIRGRCRNHAISRSYVSDRLYRVQKIIIL